MNYLKLETCNLLLERGCVSESDHAYVRPLDESKDYHLNLSPKICSYGYQVSYVDAFTWDDICTKENAIKIWGELDENQPITVYLRCLLDRKLNGEDWEAELLKQLEGK